MRNFNYPVSVIDHNKQNDNSNPSDLAVVKQAVQDLQDWKQSVTGKNDNNIVDTIDEAFDVINDKGEDIYNDITNEQIDAWF